MQYSVLERPADDLLMAVQRNNLSVLAYFPLASGLLTGKYRRGQSPPADSRLGADGLVSTMLRDGIMARRPPLSDERLTTVERLTTLAGEHDRSVLELAISWLASQPKVGCVITGVTKAEQVLANAAAAHWELSDDVAAGIERIVAEEL
jgi:aryl-alcohol dehydrogenase-like predicted oxidoreductase